MLANGVPAVVQYPNNDGPVSVCDVLLPAVSVDATASPRPQDYSARARAALQSPWPHLSVLGSAAELRGVFDVLGPVCASVKAKRPNFFCALFTANPDDGTTGAVRGVAVSGSLGHHVTGVCRVALQTTANWSL